MDPAALTPADMREDTIFAVASGQGRAAIAVIRLSGAGTGAVVGPLLGGRLPAPRRASLRRLRDPMSGETLDEAVVVWMPGPSTFTGEDQAELHIHGGLAVRSAVLKALADRPGCRPAGPGEFTRRAFLNGRLDLTAVEGVADLVEAETQAQRRQALRQLDGALARAVGSWRERLVDALAHLEASLDFSDEEDVPADVAAGRRGTVDGVRAEIAAALAGAGRAERLREGFVVVIAGPPNAGKSTLLNAIARREVAIVSDVPGTTRDAIEVRCDLDGLPVTFVDTAGLRASDDPVERIGMDRARDRMARADLVLWLAPPGEIASPPPGLPAGTATLVVRSKADLAPPGEDGEHSVSALTGAGLPELLAAVCARAECSLGDGGDGLVTRERHRLALEEALASLVRSQETDAPELAAEDLRLALRALGGLVGQVGSEEILDRIFASFCIGK